MKNVTPCFLSPDKNTKPNLSTIRSIIDYSKAYKCVTTRRIGRVGLLMN
jgi:hypothetical protein